MKNCKKWLVLDRVATVFFIVMRIRVTYITIQTWALIFYAQGKKKVLKNLDFSQYFQYLYGIGYTHTFSYTVYANELHRGFRMYM